jgi:hypothetical protein
VRRRAEQELSHSPEQRSVHASFHLESLMSLPGLQDLGSAQDPIYSAVFAPKNYARRVPQTPLPVHMNFWLFEGKPPADG